MLEALASTWLYPEAGTAPASGKGARLFPWTLLKAFLSSHRALQETIANRRARARGVRRVRGAARGRSPRRSSPRSPRRSTLPAKLDRLVTELKSIGIGRRSPTRVVVFSERIATLRWLAA